MTQTKKGEGGLCGRLSPTSRLSALHMAGTKLYESAS